MTKSEQEVKEIRDAYAKWAEEYKPIEFVDDYGSEEGKAKLAKAGEDHIFTYNTTCTEEMMSQGQWDYTGSCCWMVHGYWITEKPWTEDVHLAMSVAVPCLTCNPNEIEDFEGNESCDDCGGGGVARYYAED
jgi:DnaJ-class molecular chaperone